MKVTVDLPDELQQEVSFTLTGRALEYQIQTAVAAALVEANATIKTLQDAAKEQARACDVLSTDSEVLLRENREFSARIDVLTDQLKQRDALIANLKMQLVEALKGTPPPVIEPVPPVPPVVPVTPLKPIITKTELVNVAGFCITLGEQPPSVGVDATARALIEIGGRMGFNCVRLYRNKDEVRADVKRTDEDLRNLYAFAQQNGMLVVADTVDRAALEFEDHELRAYVHGLEDLGAVLHVFNDANQYRTGTRKDGTPYPPRTLEDMVKRVRGVTDMPIMASVTAGAKIEDYKPLFDFVEAQTFGKPSELDTFLDRGFDAYCLNGQQSVSLDYLRKAHDIILKDNPSAFWYYTAWDEKTLWTAMPQHTALIEKTVQAWNAARIVKAQPA